MLVWVISTGPDVISQPWLSHDAGGAAHSAWCADQLRDRPDGYLAARVRPATGPARTADLTTRLAATPTRPHQPLSTP